MIKKINETNVTYLRSHAWELNEEMVVPKEIDDWAIREGFGNQEEGYLVKLNGQFGYLYNEEYTHDQQTSGFQKDFALEHNLVSEQVLKQLNEKAGQLSAQTDDSIIVLVGDKTGIMECHEFCLFFPFGTDNKTYKQTLETLEEIGQARA